MPATFDSDGKAAYIYHEASDTWYQVSGKTDISGTFEWSGYHTHLSTLTAAEHLVGKKGINNFLNPTARDSAIPSPTAGTICLIRQDSIGNQANELQYYDGTSWIALIPSQHNNEGKFLKTNGIISSWQIADDGIITSLMLMGG